MNFILSNNLIKNCPVTTNDYRRAVDIYGVYLGLVRGKTVRVRSVHLRTDIITPLPDKPLELHVLVPLCANFVYINSDICLETVSRKITLVTVFHVERRKYHVLLPVLMKVITLYQYRGFKVEFIFTDDEFSVMSIKLLEKG